MTFSRSWYLPASLLLIMFVLMLGSVRNDSATYDERAHIPAGYSYIKFLDYRLNPEHPPLVKTLAGIPLLFLKLNYPLNDASWTTDVNGQWVQGTKFLYESGNDADKILFWARLPMILLTLLTGALIYWWVKTRFGRKVGLMTLALFAFSPTFLAQGRYVTTDIGAALGFLLGIVAFLRFLESPNWKNVLLAGFAFGFAELLKFSTVLLVPVYAVMIAAWILSRMGLSWRVRVASGIQIIFKTITIGIIGMVSIYAVYALFTFNYPAERQTADSRSLLSQFAFKPLVEIQERLAENSFARPLAHYLLGVMMAGQRAGNGNTTYFWNEVSSAGSVWYFPVMYFTKETLGFLLLFIITIATSVVRIYRARPWSLKRIGYWVENNFSVFSAVFFVAFYWLYSLNSSLNIGVRHILPAFPFIYLLVSREVTLWLRGEHSTTPQNWRAVLRTLYQRYLLPIPRYITVVLIFFAIILDVLLVFPHFLSYYNQIAGGPTLGYRVAVDSNYDWGQDLKRLADYVKSQNIRRISLDYFGGGEPRYYLGETFEPWWSARGPASGYFAISATLLQGSTHPVTKELTRANEDSYEWLKPYQPIDRVGYSIFIYKLP